MTASGGTADHHTHLLRDSLVVFWTVLWLAMGLLTGYQVWSLSRVSEAASASARAADTAGEALQELSRIPLVPEGPGRLGDEVQAAAAEIRRSSLRVEQDLRRLSVLIGATVAVVPTVPVLAWYLPGRVRWGRNVGRVRAELERDGRTARLDAYLAHRAVSEMGYAELAALSDDPLADLAAGRHRALASEQLRRMGLSTAPEPGATGT